MFGENDAHQWVKTFIDQCRTGKLAELHFSCERGHLKVTMCADLGPVGHNNVNLSDCRGVQSGSPSRVRRRERRAAERAAAEISAAVKVATERNAAEKAAAEKCAAEKAATEKCDAEKAAAEKSAVEKAAAEKRAAEKAAAEKSAAEKAAAEKHAAEKAAAEKSAAEKAAAEKCATEKVAAEEAAFKAAAEAAKVAAESIATTAAAKKVGAKVTAASDQATTSGMNSHCECEELVPLAEAEQNFSEFRMRWVKRLDKSTDDCNLKTKLLESLEDAYLAPVSVLSNGDFNEVKDKFFEGILSPVRFLEDLHKLLGKN